MYLKPVVVPIQWRKYGLIEGVFKGDGLALESTTPWDIMTTD